MKQPRGLWVIAAAALLVVAAPSLAGATKGHSARSVLRKVTTPFRAWNQTRLKTLQHVKKYWRHTSYEDGVSDALSTGIGVITGTAVGWPLMGKVMELTWDKPAEVGCPAAIASVTVPAIVGAAVGMGRMAAVDGWDTDGAPRRGWKGRISRSMVHVNAAATATVKAPFMAGKGLWRRISPWLRPPKTP